MPHTPYHPASLKLQQPLLPLKESAQSAPLIVSTSNQEACTWISAWPAWPSSGLMISAPPGRGAGYLGRLWQARSGAIDWSALSMRADTLPDLQNKALYIPPDTQWAGERTQEEGLLHIFNILKANHGTLMLVTRPESTTEHVTLPDLSSRLKTLPTLQLGIPDDRLFFLVIRQLFQHRQIDVRDTVVHFIAHRIARCFHAAADIVQHLNAASMAEKRALSLDFVRAHLKHLSPDTVPDCTHI